MELEAQFATPTDALRAAIQAELRAMFTTLPGTLAAQGDGHNAAANSTILGLVRQDDGTTTQVAMPEFPTLPVHFAGGGQVVSTHPLHQGDEGILLFAARAINSWRQSGGQQAPIDSRQHSLSDAFWLGGVKSDPNKIANYAPDSVQHRSIDGKVTHDVHPTNGTTTKVVDPSDASTDPFNSATKYHSTAHNPTGGIVHTATDGTNNHVETLLAAIGKLLSVTKAGKTHTISVHPDDGITIASSVAVSLSAPPGMLGLPAGGVDAGALAGGAAASNVGALGGDLAGSLPDPQVVGATGLPVYASNAAATAAGLAVGGLYANNTISGSEHVVCVVH